MELNRSTRHSDLPQNAQTLLDQLQAHIIGQIAISNELSTRDEELLETIRSVPTDIGEVQKRLAKAQSALNNDMTQLQDLRAQVDLDREHVQLSTRFVDAVKSGAASARQSKDPILQYFHHFAGLFGAEIESLATSVGAIDKHVDTLERRDTMAGEDPNLLVEALKEQQKAFLSVSGKVAGIHDEKVSALAQVA